MPINPAIALGVQPMQLADPLAQYGKFAAIQQAQSQNALAQYQLDAARRESEKAAALNALYAGAVTPEGGIDYNKLTASAAQQGMGALVPGILKGRREYEESAAKANEAFGKAVEQRMKVSRNLLEGVSTPEQYIAWHEANHRDPVLAKFFAERGITAEDARSRIQAAVAAGPQAFEQLLAESKIGAEKVAAQIAEANKPIHGAAGGFIYDPRTQTFRQAPAASRLLTPEEEAQKIRIAKEGRPATTVVLPPQEKAEQTERGKLLVKQYGNVSDAARLAAKTLPSLETQERVLDSGFKTGFGTDAQKAGASVLAALGVPEAEKYATNAQTFLSATQQAVLQRQLEQKGPQTEADAQRITQTGAQLGNTPEANKFIIATAKAQLKRDIAQRNFYDNWWQKNKTYDGAEDAWFSGEGGKSLFEDSALKKFAPALAKPASATTAPASAGVQPFSDAAKERRYQEWKRSQGKP